MFENYSVNQLTDPPPSRWPQRATIYDVGTEKNAWSSHCLHASWGGGREGGLAWFPRVIFFKGVINFKSSQDRLWLGRNNVNNPRASGDALALDCGGRSKFLFKVERKVFENADRARPEAEQKRVGFEGLCFETEEHAAPPGLGGGN